MSAPGSGTVYAAVSAILRYEAGRYMLLIVKRAENPNDPWSGDWALPGGRREPGDLTLLDTAMRETMEETGIDLRSDAELLYEMEYYSPSTVQWISVKPFVFRLRRLGRIRLSPELVDYVWSPLDGLVTSRDDRGGPVFALGGGERIWGMTARILLDLKGLLR